MTLLCLSLHRGLAWQVSADKSRTNVFCFRNQVHKDQPNRQIWGCLERKVYVHWGVLKDLVLGKKGLPMAAGNSRGGAPQPWRLWERRADESGDQ